MARRYFPHIYFESKKPGKDSVYEAVPDLGRPGVRSAEEVKLLAAATVADLVDGKTVDHCGRKIRFTVGLLDGRFLVLRRLANKYGGKRVVDKAQEISVDALKIKSTRQRKKFVKKELRKLGISTAMIEQLIARTNYPRSSRTGAKRRARRTSARKKHRRSRR